MIYNSWLGIHRAGCHVHIYKKLALTVYANVRIHTHTQQCIPSRVRQILRALEHVSFQAEKEREFCTSETSLALSRAPILVSTGSLHGQHIDRKREKKREEKS